MYSSKPASDLEPLFRYLESRQSGSWRDFDSAVKSVVSGINDSYAVANRLAAYAFLEFSWEDRSWQFSPTVLVEAPPVVRKSGASYPSPPTSRRWDLVGASQHTADHICSVLNVVPARRFINIELPGHYLRFVRYSLPLEDPWSAGKLVGIAEVLTRMALDEVFDCLPNIRFAAEHWIGEAPEVESALLRGAFQTERFDPRNGVWSRVQFDSSPGFWRTDGIVRQYFRVSPNRTPETYRALQGPEKRAVHIVRVPPDLGRWFHASEPGQVTIDTRDQSMTLELSQAVFDIPVVYERWLALWGCARRVVSHRPHKIHFDHLEPIKAKKLATLLSLKGV